MRNVYTGNTTFLKTDALKAQQMHFQWTQQFAVQAPLLIDQFTMSLLQYGDNSRVG